MRELANAAGVSLTTDYYRCVERRDAIINLIPAKFSSAMPAMRLCWIWAHADGFFALSGPLSTWGDRLGFRLLRGFFCGLLLLFGCDERLMGDEGGNAFDSGVVLWSSRTSALATTSSFPL